MSGVPGYIRGTCNPDADSWVRKLIDWWIGPDGYPIPERSGVLRWFIRRDDTMIWGDSAEELKAKYGDDELPTSLTFIPSKLDDNQILVKKDPTYRAKLRALPRVDRLRLEGGNWNVRASAGNVFRKEWFRVVDAVPPGWMAAIRFWDRAATKPKDKMGKAVDPDWTRGVKMLRYPDGRYLVVDLRSLQDTPGKVEEMIRGTAAHDGYSVQIMAQQDPGSAGVGEAEHFTRMLGGFMVKTDTFTGDKVTRAKPFSAQCEAGNVMILRAPWNDEYLQELENFPDGKHDDCVDASSGAFNELAAGGFSILNAL